LISGTCWTCEPGDADGYAYEPFGFEVDKVEYQAQGKLKSDVTGLYEYLLSNTKDGAENFENATIQHVAYLLGEDVPYYATQNTAA
jgi:hypothetical protein